MPDVFHIDPGDIRPPTPNRTAAALVTVRAIWPDLDGPNRTRILIWLAQIKRLSRAA